MLGEVPLALSTGTVFHRRYEIVRAMRAGGMGAVYEVVHVATRRRAALKVMLPSLVHDAELRSRFELEAHVTADVESEHIVDTLDAGVDEETGVPFLVMDLLRGEDLREVLEHGRLEAGEVVRLLGQAAFALERTHGAGIVHRDLKPENLFVTRRDDGSPHLKILDFGIAKLVAQSTQSMRTTRSMGTPCYMAPEQIRGDGDIDHRADIYSLGQIAFALLVGQAYWQTEARESATVYPLLMKISQGAKEAPTERAKSLGVALPSAFDAWFGWATAVDPRDRATDVRTVVRELARSLDVPFDEPVPIDRLPFAQGSAALRSTPPAAVTSSLSVTMVPAGGIRRPPRRGAFLATAAGLAAMAALGSMGAWTGLLKSASRSPVASPAPPPEVTTAPVAAVEPTPASTASGTAVPARSAPADELLAPVGSTVAHTPSDAPSSVPPISEAILSAKSSRIRGPAPVVKSAVTAHSPTSLSAPPSRPPRDPSDTR